jgi:dTDP-glucose 4,6-dehydratase/UDP-glucose 4-epimerase
MRVLVTGGAGFIGSSLCKHLYGLGHEVTVLDDLSRGKAERLRNTPVNLIPGDIRDEMKVHRAVQGQDAVIHLAYLQGTQTFYAEPRQVLDVALRGVLNLMSACEQWGCGDFLLVSSSEAYQVAPEVPTGEDVPLTVPDVLNPRYSYGGGKIASELVTLAWQRTGVLDRAVIARPHNIYGPDMGREHVIPEFCLRMNQLVKEQPSAAILPFPIQGTGLETRSFCYISDCVEQLALLLEKGQTGVYHVGTMVERSIEQVAHEVAACYGKQVKVIPGTLPKGSPPKRLPDTTKMDQLAGIGNLVRTPFKDGLSATVTWYQNNG